MLFSKSSEVTDSLPYNMVWNKILFAIPNIDNVNLYFDIIGMKKMTRI